MKKILTILTFLFAVVSFSQNFLSDQYVEKLKKDMQGNVQFISFKQNSTISNSLSLEVIQLAIGSPVSGLTKTNSETDKKGNLHETFSYSLNGVPIEFSSVKVHSKNGFITSINGNLIQLNPEGNPENLKSPEEIMNLGLSHLGTNYQVEMQGQNERESTLVILPASLSYTKTDRYAYKYVLSATNPVRLERVYIDALNGQVLFKDALMKNHQDSKQPLNEKQINYLQSKKNLSSTTLVTGNAETKYSGDKEIETTEGDDGFYLYDSVDKVNTRDIQHNDALIIAITASFLGFDAVLDMTKDFLDNDNNWTEAEHKANKDDAAHDVHWGVTTVKKYFKDVFDRNSYDNNGAEIYSFVHAGTNYANAAWVGLDVGEGFMMYGDGDYNPDSETGSYDALVSLDVTAHELGHAVNGSECDMVYEREPGALNEGLSDIWGAVIEAYGAPEKDKWIIGEDFTLGTPSGIRSMEDPKIFNQPSTYLGDFWVDASPEGCPTPDITNDQCGVHTNSGVLNHWFYLLSDGGSGTNDNDFEFSVDGIGMDKSAEIVYDVETNFAESDTDYESFKDYTLEVAAQNYGEESDELKSLKSAWCAVGVITGEECTNMGTQENKLSKVSIYPNPVKDFLYIHNANHSKFTNFSIINAVGQLLSKGEIIDGKINVTILPKGVYLLKLSGNETGKSFKFVKN